jgi:nucleoside-diphosphate-sugar epimerase
MRNSALINLNTVTAAATAGAPRYFLSSSVCVYRDMAIGEPELTEEDAYPAFPDNEYGWEKLYAERTLLAYARRHGFAARIARFQNCYGPEGTWRGGREKAPAAICRKVAEVEDVDDMVDGIVTLAGSELEGPANIGNSEYVTVDELVQTVIRASGKTVRVKHVDGPVGVRSRNFSHRRIESLGWRARVSLAEGITRTYEWIEGQVQATAARSSG